MYNGDGNRKLSYSYGRDGNIASSFDSATGEKTVFCYDLANRAVGQKTYVGSTLSSSLAYTYADKTNYLVGVKHKFALGEQTIGYRYGNLSVGEMPDQIYGVTWNGKEKIGYSYDGFGRITDKTVMPSLSKTLHNRYTYYNRESGNRTSTTVKSLETANGTYTYTYDAAGNILSINDGTYTVSYVYDGLNQLVRENDQRADTTTVYTYTSGNITGKKVYKYTLGNVGEELKSTSYGYSNSEWRDLLTSFNGQAVTYDEIGNPITFGSKSFEWCGRQLERITDGDNTYVYAYNTDGDRVSKTVNGVKTEYFYNGSILAGQKTGDETLIFMYDNNGDAFGFIYNGEEYYYIKNVQNDIVAIADKNGTVVANYYYDAWGNITQITGNTALAQTNPLRYRSYYYDSETGYYHLKSRYYSPEVGRFLNADGYAQTGQGLLDKNMFAYCGNNPVNRRDGNGNAWKDVKKWFSKRWNAFKNFVGNTFGTNTDTVVTSSESVDVVIPNYCPITAETGARTTTVTSSVGKKKTKAVTAYANKNATHPIRSSSAGVKIITYKSYLQINLSVDNLSITGGIINGDITKSFGQKVNFTNLTAVYTGTTEIKWDDKTTETIYTDVGFSGYALLALAYYLTSGEPAPATGPFPQLVPAQ